MKLTMSAHEAAGFVGAITERFLVRVPAAA